MMRSPPKERLELPALERFLRYCKPRKVRAKTMIIEAGDECDSLYYVLSGSVEVMIDDENGDEIVLAYLNKGHFFGEMGFFGSAQSRTAWVRARGSCELAEMTYPLFQRLAEENPELVVELATQLASRVVKTNLKVADLAFLDVSGRVAHALMDLAAEPDAEVRQGGIWVTLTRPQLARLVGCSREMASRVLKAMESQGLVASESGGVLLPDGALGRQVDAKRRRAS